MKKGLSKKDKQSMDQTSIHSVEDKVLKFIFSELIISKNSPFITYPIFYELMMDSNLHRSCVINFEVE